MSPARPKPVKPTLVLLVRHGQTPTTGRVLPGRAPGLHLSDDGRKQAEAVAQRIAALKTVDAVYSSPLERTRETAAPIAKARGLKVVPHKGLLECDFGEWTGDELKQLSKAPEWRTVQRYPSGFRFPAGESFSEMQARITGTITDLPAKHPGGTIVCVSHAEPIIAALDAPGPLPTELDLVEPVVAEWVIGSLSAAYDDSADRVVVIAEELVGDEDDESGGVIVAPGNAHIGVTREQAAAFAMHATR